MIKEIKYGGFTASPSDYESPDGELDMAINLVPKIGELKPMHTPTTIGTLANDVELIYVHTVNDNTKHLILRKGTTLQYTTDPLVYPTTIDTFTTSDFKCTATGNVLCVYGTGELKHYVFLRGKYVPFNASDYAITVLFGLQSELKTNSATLTHILKGSGGSVSTWSILVTQSLESVSTGVWINYTFKAGQKYRIRFYKTTATSTIYKTLDYYDSSGTFKETVKAGAVDVDFEFTPSYNISKIYVGFWSDSGYSYIWTSNWNGTLYVEKQEEEIEPSSDYAYNATEDADNQVLGLANALLSGVTTDNKFALPFFVRYGFRMITGDIITVSPPILMEPNTGVAPLLELSDIEETYSGSNYYNATGTAKLYSSKLQYMVRDIEKLQGLLNVDDLVDSLVIAVSDPVYMYKEGATLEECQASMYVTSTAPESKNYSISGINTLSGSASYYLVLPHFDSYKEKVLAVSNFKIVKEIKKNDISLVSSWKDVSLDDGKLEGLSGITSLLPDNTENLSTYDAKFAMSYNQREHLVNVDVFEFCSFDLDAMCGFVQGTDHYTNIKVGIQLNSSQALQYTFRGRKTESSINRRWFYHPNSKAKEVWFYENSKAYKYALTPHDFLVGSYWFQDGCSTTGDSEGTGVNHEKTTISETKQNMIYVSEQGNPLIIAQRIRVGDGILYSAASNTKPISRGQFGQSPLYAFSSDGIWAIEVATDGTYSVRQPVSRDVCINADSITPVDGAVLFVTDRGVMLLEGAETKCITEDIDLDSTFSMSSLGTELSDYIKTKFGTSFDMVSFRTYLAGSRIIYDYVNQIIILFNSTKNYAYVYSFATHRWGMMQSDISYTVNTYPDAWAVNSNRVIKNYSDAVISEALSTPCLLVTRPLKLDTADILKTVDTVIQRGKFVKGHVSSILYGSRDLIDWSLVWSSSDHYLRGFRGTPYKYFRIALICDLKYYESIFGATFQFNPRLINQPR